MVYEIPVPELPPVVNIRGDLLGCIEDLTYYDHNLTNEKKFSWFQPDYYQKSEHGGEVVSPVDWVVSIYHSTIMNVLQLLHFGRSP